MKSRTTRRKVQIDDIAEPAEEDDNASTSNTPQKDKENLSPFSSKGRLSFDTHQQKLITLLKDFDQTVAMNKKDIQTQTQMMADNLTLPFLTGLMKMPPQIKNLKWGDYLKMKSGTLEDNEKGTMKTYSESSSDIHKFAVPSGPSKLETPALRSSSRLAKNKLPVITPKFDPSTPAPLNKRLPKPGEVLVSLKGSPVAVPNPTPFTGRGLSNLAASDDRDVLMALLSNPDTVTNALKDKNTCKAFVKAYNSAKLRKD